MGKNFFEVFHFNDKEKIQFELNQKGFWRGLVSFFFRGTNFSFFVSFSQNIEKQKLFYVVQLFLVEDSVSLLEPSSNSYDEILKQFNGFTSVVENLHGEEKAIFSSNIFNEIGYKPEEISQLPGKLLSITHKDDVAKIIKEKNILLKDYKTNSLEIQYRLFHKDGRIIWIKEKSSITRNTLKGITVVNSTYLNITSIKENEVKLQEQLAELKEESISKEKFISLLAHELRGPFTSILGFSEILLSDNDLPEKEKLEYLNYIFEASQKQLELVNYLLDYSRLRTGSIKVEKQRLKVSPLLYQSISAMTGNAIRKNIEMKLIIGSELYIHGDGKLLHQVFLNLIGNAIKFSYENSHLEIYANLFNKEYAEFIIKDFGRGLSQSDQEKIFSLEKNFTKEGTKGEKGSGLGLALVKEIIEKHNGEIWFYSDEGKGTEFHFTIPISEDSILLLINDLNDKRLISKLIKETLPAFKIYHVKNSYEAIDYFANKLPSLFVTNHNLPLMNGLQLLESLKSSSGTLKTPIVSLLNQNEKEFAESYYKIGAVEVFIKPIIEEEFSRTILTTLT